MVSGAWEEAHWNVNDAKGGKKALFVDVEWKTLLDPNIQSPLDRSLRIANFPQANWNTPRSGIHIADEIVEPLATARVQHLNLMDKDAMYNFDIIKCGQ